MIDKFAPMFTPSIESLRDHGLDVLERALQLSRRQLDVAENVYGEVTQEYRAFLAPAEPVMMLKVWPKFLENTSRSAIEASAVLLKNAFDFQNELIQTMQARMPQISNQFMAAWAESTPAGAAAESAPTEHSPQSVNRGGAKGSGARKAA